MGGEHINPGGCSVGLSSGHTGPDLGPAIRSRVPNAGISRMRFVVQITAVVLTLTLLGWYWLLGYRAAPEPLDLVVPALLKPGQLFTGQVAVNCDWYGYAQQRDVLD